MRVRAAHSPFNREYAPFAGPPPPLERMTAAINKTQARTRHQVLNRARHKPLACTGECRHGRADVNGNAAYIIADHLALASVNPGPHVNAQRPDRAMIEPLSSKLVHRDGWNRDRVMYHPLPNIFTNGGALDV